MAAGLSLDHGRVAVGVAIGVGLVDRLIETGPTARNAAHRPSLGPSTDPSSVVSSWFFNCAFDRAFNGAFNCVLIAPRWFRPRLRLRAPSASTAPSFAFNRAFLRFRGIATQYLPTNSQAAR
jgi:hypothetical protein